MKLQIFIFCTLGTNGLNNSRSKIEAQKKSNLGVDPAFVLYFAALASKADVLGFAVHGLTCAKSG